MHIGRSRARVVASFLVPLVFFPVYMKTALQLISGEVAFNTGDGWTASLGVWSTQMMPRRYNLGGGQDWGRVWEGQDSALCYDSIHNG
ncbi:hypothetical protein EV421DRAFT_125155 [Armillaria borealis]|uniref:Uncharacterized protein n=1 Tax=Armillaria borealis TaxID=47425 RepID=A0AA39IWY5_9AGAR|nr:hypothetical protein EV421DRAFT_125155 [Armillaria borealis]